MHLKLAGIIFLGLAAALGTYGGLCMNWASIIVAVVFCAVGLILFVLGAEQVAYGHRISELERRAKDTEGAVEAWELRVKHNQDFTDKALDALRKLVEEAKQLAGRATFGGRG